MGIRGLSSFFKQNPDLSKPFKLHDSLVVMDGNNLIHAIYFDYRLNFMYGGDYKKYADAIKKYMLVFIECGIKPIVILDGGSDKSDRKLRTSVQRMTDRFTQVQYIAKHGSSYGRVLPILAYEVFRSVLIDLDIMFAQCDYEADDQVTALANYYDCPVISADSDFYIFDIQKGFIHLNSLEMTINLETDASGKEYKFLNCNIYYIDDFISCFPGISKSILPLFGTLMGNDFVQGKEFHNFFSNIQLPKYHGKKLILNSNHKKIISLLCWLKHNTINEALNQVMIHLKKDKREYIKSVIEDSVNVYKSIYSNLTYVIDNRINGTKSELLSSMLTTPCENSLPKDFVVKFHTGHFPPFFANAICLHRVFLQPQVENTTYSSSYACSSYIRQVLYGILLRHDTDCGECESKACLSYIEEYDRQRKSLQKECVEPVFSLEGFGTLPKINELPCLEKDRCKLILFKTFGISSDFFVNVPNKWQLIIGCINFWLRNCTPYSSEAFIYAVILNLIYFSLIKYKLFANQLKCCNEKSAGIICSCSSVTCILSMINETDLQYAAKNLDKYTHKPSFNHGNPLILHIIHSYSQLQTCILFSVYLNKLLGDCVENIESHKCLGGSLLYNLARDIFTRSNPELFIAEILGRGKTLHSLFTVMYSKVCQHVPSECILKNNSFQKHKNKKKKKCTKNEAESSLSGNKFDILKNALDLELL